MFYLFFVSNIISQLNNSNKFYTNDCLVFFIFWLSHGLFLPVSGAWPGQNRFYFGYLSPRSLFPAAIMVSIPILWSAWTNLCPTGRRYINSLYHINFGNTLTQKAAKIIEFRGLIFSAAFAIILKVSFGLKFARVAESADALL